MMTFDQRMDALRDVKNQQFKKMIEVGILEEIAMNFNLWHGWDLTIEDAASLKRTVDLAKANYSNW